MHVQKYQQMQMHFTATVVDKNCQHLCSLYNQTAIQLRVGYILAQLGLIRQAWLVPGWMTVSGSIPGAGHLSWYITSHPGQLSLASFRG